MTRQSIAERRAALHRLRQQGGSGPGAEKRSLLRSPSHVQTSASDLSQSEKGEAAGTDLESSTSSIFKNKRNGRNSLQLGLIEKAKCDSSGTSSTLTSSVAESSDSLRTHEATRNQRNKENNKLYYISANEFKDQRHSASRKLSTLEKLDVPDMAKTPTRSSEASLAASTNTESSHGNSGMINPKPFLKQSLSSNSNSRIITTETRIAQIHDALGVPFEAIIRPTEAQLRWAHFHRQKRAQDTQTLVERLYQFPPSPAEVPGAFPEDGESSCSSSDNESEVVEDNGSDVVGSDVAAKSDFVPKRDCADERLITSKVSTVFFKAKKRRHGTLPAHLEEIEDGEEPQSAAINADMIQLLRECPNPLEEFDTGLPKATQMRRKGKKYKHKFQISRGRRALLRVSMREYEKRKKQMFYDQHEQNTLNPAGQEDDMSYSQNTVASAYTSNTRRSAVVSSRVRRGILSHINDSSADEQRRKRFADAYNATLSFLADQASHTTPDDMTINTTTTRKWTRGHVFSDATLDYSTNKFGSLIPDQSTTLLGGVPKSLHIERKRKQKHLTGIDLHETESWIRYMQQQREAQQADENVNREADVSFVMDGRSAGEEAFKSLLTRLQIPSDSDFTKTRRRVIPEAYKNTFSSRKLEKSANKKNKILASSGQVNRPIKEEIHDQTNHQEFINDEKDKLAIRKSPVSVHSPTVTTDLLRTEESPLSHHAMRRLTFDEDSVSQQETTENLNLRSTPRRKKGSRIELLTHSLIEKTSPDRKFQVSSNFLVPGLNPRQQDEFQKGQNAKHFCAPTKRKEEKKTLLDATSEIGKSIVEDFAPEFLLKWRAAHKGAEEETTTKADASVSFSLADRFESLKSRTLATLDSVGTTKGQYLQKTGASAKSHNSSNKISQKIHIETRKHTQIATGESIAVMSSSTNKPPRKEALETKSSNEMGSSREIDEYRLPGISQTMTTSEDLSTADDSSSQNDQSLSDNNYQLTPDLIKKWVELNGQIVQEMDKESTFLASDVGQEEYMQRKFQPHNVPGLMLTPAVLTKRHQQAIRILEEQKWDKASFLISANPWLVEMTDVISGQLLLHTLALHGESAPEKLNTDLIHAFPSSVHKFDFEGNLPLHMAAESGNLPMICALGDLFHKGASVQNNRGMLPLHMAVLSGVPDAVVEIGNLFPNGTAVADNEGNLPLHLTATLQGDVGVRIVKLLLGFDTPVNIKKGVSTPLMDVDESDLSVFENFGFDSDEDEANFGKKTIHSGLYQNNDGLNPLTMAVLSMSGWEVVGALLNGPGGCQASFELDKEGNGALHYACYGEAADAASVLTILKNTPSSATVENAEGILPIELACMQGMPRQVLLAIVLSDLPFDMNLRDCPLEREGFGQSWWYLVCECNDDQDEIVRDVLSMCSYPQKRMLCFMQGRCSKRSKTRAPILTRATPSCKEELKRALRFADRFEFLTNEPIYQDDSEGIKVYEVLDFGVDDNPLENGKPVQLTCYSKEVSYRKDIAPFEEKMLHPAFVEQVYIINLDDNQRKDMTEMKDHFFIATEQAELTLDGVVSNLPKSIEWRYDEDRHCKYLTKVCAVLRVIGKAIRHLHNQGIVHGLISLETCGKFGSQWKLTSVVGAQFIGDNMSSSRLGTHSPPEAVIIKQLNRKSLGRPSFATTFKTNSSVDIWAFGKLMFEALTGESIFAIGGSSHDEDDEYCEENSIDVFNQKLLELGEWNEGKIVSVSDRIEELRIGQSCSDLITKCLSAKQTERPPKMDDVLKHPFWEEIKQRSRGFRTNVPISPAANVDTQENEDQRRFTC